jgi:hypothetical protein
MEIVVLTKELATCKLQLEVKENINGSYITLILKVDNRVKLGDFRRISLLNNSIKLLTKLLSDSKVILTVRANMIL